jgi:hypothetical protein
LTEAEQKATSAAMEKDYIIRVQKQYETYYEKAFSAQIWTLTIMGLILTALFVVAGVFSYKTFDRQIDLALRETSAQLRTEFAERLANETNALQEAHASELKVLEDALKGRIAQQEQDLKLRSNYQFQFAQGIGFLMSKDWTNAIKHFRLALGAFKEGKPRGIFGKQTGNRPAANIFFAIRARDKGKFEDAAKRELELDLYKDLEDELNFAAIEVAELAPLLLERNSSQGAQAAAAPKPGVAAPNVPQPPPTPKDGK